MNLTEKQLKAELRKKTRYLRDLTVMVRCFLDSLDLAMNDSASCERRKRIAALCNALNMANDSARYFGLGIDYRTDKKDRPAKAGGTKGARTNRARLTDNAALA